jgi:hypothetical protein
MGSEPFLSVYKGINMNVVIAIDRIPCSELSGLYWTGNNKVKVMEGLSWEPVNIKIPASLSITDKDDDKNQLYTATLKFKTCEKLSRMARYAYRATLTDGTKKIIGTDQRPFPVVTITQNMPENVTDNQLDEVTVTWTVNRQIPDIDS